jgi:diguanylate cyclase (GGDEF)-like protein
VTAGPVQAPHDCPELRYLTPVRGSATAARLRVVMTTARLTVRLPVTLALVAAVVAAQVAVDAGGLLTGHGRRLLDTGVLFVAGALAAAVCFHTAGPLSGSAHRWRHLMGIGLTGWSLGHLVLGLHEIVDPGAAPTVSPADVGFLTLPVCAVLALLAVATGLPRPTPTSPRRDRVVLVLDSVLITGSLLALTWSTAFGGAARAGEASPLTFAAALTYPVADLVLAAMVGLLLTTRPASRPLRRPMLPLGAGLVAFAVSDGLHVTRLASGAMMTPLAGAGFLVGPALIALAASSSPSVGERPSAERTEADWLHLLLPYVPVIATGVMIAVRTGTGGTLSPFEAYLGWLGLGLVVARQMLTIVDNTVLLARVSEGQQRLHHQAFHDPLTGLANRALFRERLVLSLQRHRVGQPMALLFADLDDFKAINDSFGHAVGDRLLHAVGDRLLGCVRRDDVVARLGGDEFAVLIERQPGDAEPVGQRILSSLREPFVVDGHTVTVSASLGLVVPDRADALSADALLRRADAAMYAGKRRGKGALVRYDHGADGTIDADLPHLLARALGGAPADAGFEVYYQPIVRFSDGVTVAVEALARWTDPVAGVVDPDVFVTVAERTGLVAALDDFVLDRACADAEALAETYGGPVDVHVNVSAARLGQRGLEDTVARALQRHGVRPARLVVEITETRRIPDLALAAEVAVRLRESGVRVALDDFGSGFNALAQLHALPVDIVKLDSTLTDVDTAPERAAALCRSVLTICAELRIAVVAEGVETVARADALAGLGCVLGQGYLFGPPRPVHRLADAVIPVSPAVIPAQAGPTSTHLAS